MHFRYIDWFKPKENTERTDQCGPCSIQLIPRAVIIWQATYSSQACHSNTHLDLGCIGQEAFRSSTAKPLQGQLASRRNKILPGHVFAGLLTNFTGKTGLPDLGRQFSGTECSTGITGLKSKGSNWRIPFNFKSAPSQRFQGAAKYFTLRKSVRYSFISASLEENQDRKIWEGHKAVL